MWGTIRMLLLLVVIATLCGSITAEGPQVDTSYGTVEGVSSSHSFGDVTEFLGVPYAAPPLGNLRFKPPQPHEGWSGVKMTTAYGQACEQDTRWTNSPVWNPLRHTLPTKFGEDCLFLNIHIPGNTINRTKKLPVLVYIHGGAYFFGCSDMYRGDAFAAKEEVIIVTLNYRVNYFGFLTTGDDRIPGNMGLLDQVQAFKWLQKNIENFGGDPNKVTLIGESAGAWCVSLHAVSPMSKGLFQRAIVMSGVEITRKFYERSYIKAEDAIQSLLTHLNCGGKDAVQCLQEANAMSILSSMYLHQAPVVDGPGGFLPEQPGELWKKGQINVDALMAGTVRDDGEVVVRLLKNVVYLNFFEGIDIEQVRNYVHDLQIFFEPSLDYEGFSEMDIETESIIVDQYVQNPTDKLDNLRATVDLLTDSVFAAQARVALDSMVDHGRLAYQYYHTHKGALSPKGYPIEMGPFHAEGIHYLFGIYANEEYSMYNASDTFTNDVAKAMMTGFAAFADHRDVIFVDGSGNEHNWPPFDHDDENYLEFESELSPASVQKGLLPRAVNFWNVILPKLKQCNCEETRTTVGPAGTAAHMTSGSWGALYLAMLSFLLVS